MIIECPECGTKNQTDKPPQPGKRYRCGKCKAIIPYLQIPDTPPEPASVPTKQETDGVAADKTPIKRRSVIIPNETVRQGWSDFFKMGLPQMKQFMKEKVRPQKQDTSAKIPKEKTQPKKQQEVKKKEGSKPSKGLLIVLGVIVVIAIVLYFSGYIG
ncbi:hypothetical protein ACFLUU_01990 [Chloroflexota bacterium]